jgi:hypothetical protein
VVTKELLQKEDPLNQNIQLFSIDFFFSDFTNNPESRVLELSEPQQPIFRIDFVKVMNDTVLPTGSKKARIVRMMIVAAGRLAFVMDDDTFRCVQYFETLASSSKAKVEVFEPVNECFVKSAKGKEQLSRHEHTCGGDGLEFPAFVGCRMERTEVSVNVVNLGGTECHTCVLDCAVWVKKFAPDNAGISIARDAINKRRDPSCRDFCVIVQENKHVSRCAMCTLIACFRKPQICRVPYYIDFGVKIFDNARGVVG